MSASMKRYIHIAIMFALIIVISMMEPFGQITPFGMKALGLFVGVLYGWIFIDLVFPSLMGFVLMPVMGLMQLLPAMSAGFGNVTFLMILPALVFAGAMEEAGVSSFIGNWLLKQKVFRKSPWMLVIGFAIIAFVLGAAGATMAGIFLLWSIVIKIADLTGMEKKNKLISFMIFLIVAAAYMGCYVMPFQIGALMCLGFHPVAYSYIDFFIYTMIISVVVLALFLLAARFVLRLDVSMFALPESVIEELEAKKATKQQKIGTVILVLYVLLLFLSSMFTQVPGMAMVAAWGIAGVSLVALLVMNFIVVDGKPIINIEQVFAKHTPWTLVLLLVVTFPLADLMKSADSGIMATIMGSVMPMVSQLGAVPFVIVCVVALGLLTQVTHNIVLLAMFLPMLCPIAGQLGGPAMEVVLWMLLYLVLNVAYCTPAASMPAALVHGHEYMIKKYAYTFPLIHLVIMMVICFVIGIPLGTMMF